MKGPDVQRRLMAILASDMVGYSRLMELDEAGTLARLKAHRLELIDPTVARHQGRIVKTTGDGMLVEFASVADAALSALAIQRRMARRNADVAPERRILFRIGIHLGDVIIEDDDVFGDGVNIAARLEQLAEAGGVCVSQAVHDQLAHGSGYRLEDRGEQQVKNIARPIRAYRLALDETDVAALAVAPLGAAKPSAAPEPLSIAVLPFVNMSGDSEQDFFADGLAEDIITALSHFRDLTVISRNSTFAFKGKAVNVQEFARTLNVRYVVEGSVRKAGNRVRITVQLIDAKADRHVWAGRYDRELADIFDIQDDHQAAVYHQERALRLNPNDDLIVVQHGEVLTWMGRPEEGSEWIRRAMRLNPHHPERFWNHLGRAYFVARRYPEAIESFRRISRPDQFHHAFLAAACAMAGDPAAAAEQARTVAALNPAFGIDAYMATLHYMNPQDAAHHREALARAGLPA